MPIVLKMPALSPTMEEGKLSRWLVKAGDAVKSGDILAEIETDKATMEFEAVDEGTILSIAIPEGTEGVKVGTVIATLSGEGEDTPAEAPKALAASSDVQPSGKAATAPVASPTAAPNAVVVPVVHADKRVIASPLAKRIAADRGIDLATIPGTGPNGRIVRADVEGAGRQGYAAAAATPSSAAPSALAAIAPLEMADETRALLDPRVPHNVVKLSGMRKTIARRLVQSKQEAPHIYLSVDIRLDKLLALRAELNEALERQGVKLSVNDLLIKALGKALMLVPACNVAFAGNEMIAYSRADISVAVSIPGGLITPIVPDAGGRSVSSIALAMKDLGARAREGKLQPAEYQGGTASLSNMGMMGIKQFSAVINPPQGMIMAIGAGEKRPWVMEDDQLGIATAMTATGSFDHRTIDGADGALLMAAFRELCEKPLGLLA